MRVVFLVQHSYVSGGCDETKVCGIYSTRAKARAALRRLRRQPGFCDLPDAFSVDPYPLDMVFWESGFVTIRGNRVVKTRRDRGTRAPSSNKAMERTGMDKVPAGRAARASSSPRIHLSAAAHRPR